MKRISGRYKAISGQVVNFSKSTITFSPNTDVSTRLKVYNLLGVVEIQMPGKYLGIPMMIGRKRVAEFAFLQERVEKKLQSWNNKTISKGGKVTHLKTGAQSIPNFWMALMLISLEICDGIEKRMNSYWWGNESTGKGIRWMSWDRLCVVKEDGGLGFRKLRDFNVAMLSKQAWRIINNENPLVTSHMKARYFPHTDFLGASLVTNLSYVRRSILEAQKSIGQGCQKRIGNG